jgi:imidazolonepropionase-like amidohydrolase
MKRLLLMSLLVPRLAAAEILVVEHTTLWVSAEEKLEDATLIVRDGVVLAAGRGVAVPGGGAATTIDGRGLVVTAGLVDAGARFGVHEIDQEKATVEGLPSTPADAVHAAYRVDWGFNPTSVGVDIARAGGITSAVVIPSGGLVAGRSAWISLPEGAVAPVVVRAELAVHVTLGERAKRAGKGARGMALLELRELLDDTAQYARQRRAFDDNRLRKLAATRLDLEALIPVVQGRTALVIDVRRASDIAQVIRLADELKLRVVLLHATEAWRLAPELARAKIPVIYSPEHNLPMSFDELWVRDDAPALLAKAGVDLVIAPLDDMGRARTLRQQAGIAVANGLPWPAALAAITSTPAKVFGLAPRGTLRPGQPADFVVWSGDPLELATRPVHVYVGGVRQRLENHQTELLRRYRQSPKATGGPSPTP